jgi:hypothetical protein
VHWRINTETAHIQLKHLLIHLSNRDNVPATSNQRDSLAQIGSIWLASAFHQRLLPFAVLICTLVAPDKMRQPFPSGLYELLLTPGYLVHRVRIDSSHATTLLYALTSGLAPPVTKMGEWDPTHHTLS